MAAALTKKASTALNAIRGIGFLAQTGKFKLFQNAGLE
jgi:hypothetical protein